MLARLRLLRVAEFAPNRNNAVAQGELTSSRPAA